ncbi:hypothetical protein [Bradyrhizobium japonicum]|uniref:hypothetical protein n=1 Tax=Bradyrhizobium japonicum TaxID=375 RepID=UPI000AF142DB|nr:hypothetical protein [Bradyrhizobium japonicum]
MVETIWKRKEVLETASLRGAAPVSVTGGSATGDLVTDGSRGPDGDGSFMRAFPVEFRALVHTTQTHATAKFIG